MASLMSDEDADMDYFYSMVEKSNVKMPSEAMEDDYLIEVNLQLSKGLNLNAARIKAFTKVVLK